MDATASGSEHYRRELVDTYLKRAGSFRKLFGTLLGFTAAFGFLVAWPYLGAVREEHRLADEAQIVEAELQQLVAQHERFQRPAQAVASLTRMIDDGPRLLRDYILALGNDRPFSYPPYSAACARFTDPPGAQGGTALNQLNLAAQMQQMAPPAPQPGPTGTCAGKHGQARLVCRVDRFVQFQLCEYQQAFGQQVLPALAGLQSGGRPLFDQAELEAQFARVRDGLRRHVAQNPTFWHTLRGKGEMGVELRGEVQQLWRAIAERIEPVAKDLQEQMKSARRRQGELKAESVALAKRRQSLTERLAKIQSPIGNLPIGLSESVLLFPVVLAIGFALATGSLLEQLRLRCALRNAEQGGRGGGVLTGTELAGVAPLWLEPGVSRLRRFARWLLLVVPAVAAVGTALAIALEGRAGEADMLAAGPGGALVYWLLYAASGIACLVCLWLIQRGLRRLAPVPATPPAH